MRNRSLAVLVTGGLAALTLGLSAPAAFAGTAGNPTPMPTNTCQPTVNPQDSASQLPSGHYPKPCPTPTNPIVTPTPTPTQPTPTPTVQPLLRDWTWDLAQDSIGLVNTNDVEGYGRLVMRGWRDVQINNNVDKFVRGGNSIVLWHDSLAMAQETVNRYTCTVTFDQPRGRFAVIGGTGTGANLRSINGQFDLQLLISFSHFFRGSFFSCPLAFLSDGQILRDILSSNGGGLPQPSFEGAWAQGRAQLYSVGRPIPHPFAPVAPSSSDTMSG